MRKLVLGLMGAAAMTVASGANAAVTSLTSSPGVLTGLNDGNTAFSTFIATGNTSTPFAEWVTFTETLDGTYSFNVQSTTPVNGSATDVDFTSVWLTGTGIIGSILINPTSGSTDLAEHYALTDLFLGAGTYTLHMSGTRGRLSTYTGDISFAAVPEPSTWAMMLLGFGAVGFAMRRRRRPALMQLA